MNENAIYRNPQDIIKEIYKLNIRFRVLESNVEGYLGNGRNMSHDVLNKFLTEFRQNAKSRLGDCDKLKKRICDIKLKIDKFKTSIENIQPNDEFVKSIKEVMEEIEALLTELKREQKDSYENLLRSEVSLWQECVFIERKINSWASGDQEKEPESCQKPSLVANVKETNEKSAITALQKFLDETGGKTGGWSTLDHETFMRIRLKYTGISQVDVVLYPRDEDSFIADLASLLAPKSHGEVRSHEMWYRRYRELMAEKKRAIQEWKEQKSRQPANEIGEDETEETAKSTARSDWEMQKKRLENQKRALDSWRTEKALDEHRLKVDRENALKLEIEKKKREKERERKEMRQLVDEYKQKKQSEEGEKKELELKIFEWEKEEKKKQTEVDSARINERNTRMVEERILKQHQKQFENDQRLERLNEMRNQVAVTARRDPSRLLRPTSVWIQRLADSENSGGQRDSSATTRINNVQHKAIPAWRRDAV